MAAVDEPFSLFFPLKTASEGHLFLIGLVGGLGGTFMGWNQGIYCGLSLYFINMCIILSGYVALSLCVAEMTSALPYSGGNFGFVRLALGPFPGYMIGCFEALQNMLLALSSVVALIWAFAPAIDESSLYEGWQDWICWIGLLVISIALVLLPKGVRYLAPVFATVSLSTLMLFFLCALLYGNFARNLHLHYEYVSARGFTTCNLNAITPTWFYSIMNVLPMIAGYSTKPKQMMPSLVLLCMLLFFVISFAVLFATIAVADDPQELGTVVTPFSLSFRHIFNLPARYLALLSCLPLYCTLYVLLLALSKQLTSMANSGLFSTYLKAATSSQPASPQLAIAMFVAMLSIVAFLKYAVKDGWPEPLFLASSATCYLLHVCLFLSYIVFRRKYGLLKRSFVNPLGILTAIYGLIVHVWMLAALNLKVFEVSKGLLLIALDGLIANSRNRNLRKRGISMIQHHNTHLSGMQPVRRHKPTSQHSNRSWSFSGLWKRSSPTHASSSPVPVNPSPQLRERERTIMRTTLLEERSIRLVKVFEKQPLPGTVAEIDIHDKVYAFEKNDDEQLQLGDYCEGIEEQEQTVTQYVTETQEVMDHEDAIHPRAAPMRQLSHQLETARSGPEIGVVRGSSLRRSFTALSQQQPAASLMGLEQEEHSQRRVVPMAWMRSSFSLSQRVQPMPSDLDLDKEEAMRFNEQDQDEVVGLEGEEGEQEET